MYLSKDEMQGYYQNGHGQENTALNKQIDEHLNHIVGGQPPGLLHRQTSSGKFIDHI